MTFPQSTHGRLKILASLLKDMTCMGILPSSPIWGEQFDRCCAGSPGGNCRYLSQSLLLVMRQLRARCFWRCITSLVPFCVLLPVMWRDARPDRFPPEICSSPRSPLVHPKANQHGWSRVTFPAPVPGPRTMLHGTPNRVQALSNWATGHVSSCLLIHLQVRLILAPSTAASTGMQCR